MTLHGVIGAGWMALDFDNAWNNKERKNFILEIAIISESITNSCSKNFIVLKKVDKIFSEAI